MPGIGQLLRAGTRPEVLLCADDEIALGAVTAAAGRGLRVPDDLAVTGWDDIMAARFAGLTTVAQPVRELGATATQRLHEQLSGPPGTTTTTDGDGSPPVPREETLPTRLVIRSGCGPHWAPHGPRSVSQGFKGDTTRGPRSVSAMF